jgi:tripartite-type tricarboxylate transporter receptor subunit TctC
VAKLREELVKAVRSPDVSNKITSQGLDVVTTTPDQFAALMKEDAVRLGKVVKESGAKAD